jgi:hypothetical protein
MKAALISLVAAPLAAGSAQAGFMSLTCQGTRGAYELTLDDDQGRFVSTQGGAQTQLILRGLVKEGGGVTARGHVAGRGTDFAFTQRGSSATITYSFGNGGKQVDDCRVTAQSR